MRLLDWLTGVPFPTLQGTGIRLRLPRASDYEAWRKVREESRAFLTPWEPAWASDELSRRSYMARLARYRQEARERSGYCFFLFDEASGALCGGITLGQIRRGVAQAAVLGYWMGESFAGAGRMSEAVRVVCAYAFNVEGLHRLEAACLPSNARSTALLQKSGFVREGHLRNYLKIAGVWEDHQLFALLVEDWSSSAPIRYGSRSAPHQERKVTPVSHA